MNYFMNKKESTSTINAIKAINPDAQVTVSTPSDGSKETIDWGDTTKISQADIDAKKVELGAEYDAQEYARNRAAEYPSTGDQLDYIFHNGVAKWKTDMIEPVKAKYPKPS